MAYIFNNLYLLLPFRGRGGTLDVNLLDASAKSSTASITLLLIVQPFVLP